MRPPGPVRTLCASATVGLLCPPFPLTTQAVPGTFLICGPQIVCILFSHHNGGCRQPILPLVPLELASRMRQLKCTSGWESMAPSAFIIGCALTPGCSERVMRHKEALFHSPLHHHGPRV